MRPPKVLRPFLVAMALSLSAGAARAEMLRAAWLFDDGTLNGIGPDARSGTLQDNAGAAPTFAPGVFGRTGLEFVGPDHDRVLFPGTKTSLELGTEAFTIVAWIRTDFRENVRFLQTQELSGFGDGITLFHNGGDSTLRFNQRDDSTGTFIQRDSLTDPADGQFRMFGVVRRDDGTVAIYADGAPAQVVAPGPLVNLRNTNDLTLGGLFLPDTGRLTIDDIGIFRGALSDGQIQTLSRVGLASFLVPEPASLVSLGAGLAAVAAVARRWRRRDATA